MKKYSKKNYANYLYELIAMNDTINIDHGLKKQQLGDEKNRLRIGVNCLQTYMKKESSHDIYQIDIYAAALR